MTKGFETVAFCEIDPFCRKVLAKHWPGVPCFEDITQLKKEELDSLGTIDVICGGFPCQPVSCAGKRKGKEDERWLWPEFYRIVCEVKSRWVLVENVPGLLSADSGRLFAGILRDLASSGYDAEWNIASAASVGAPHLRKRVFIVARKVADTDQIRRHGRSGMFGQGWRREPENDGEETTDHASTIRSDNWWTTEPDVGGVVDGFSAWLDGHLSDMLISHKRLIAYGVDEDTTSEKSRSREVLCVLRDQIGEERNQRTAGGLSNISEKEVLLAYLCKLSEASEALDNLPLESKEAQEDILRSVPGQNESSGPSHRSESRKQRSREHTDALQEVSRLLARDSQTAWASYRRENAATILSGWLSGWEEGIPRVAHGVPNQLDRLRALGNAIVPQCAEFVGRCVLESEARS